MAKPIPFIEQNASFIPAEGDPYAIWVRDYQLGNIQTIEAISLWEFSPVEYAEVIESGMVFLRFFGGQPPICLFHADSTEFEGQTAAMQHPDCNDLPTLHQLTILAGKPTVSLTSAWKLTPEGISLLKQNGFVALAIVGGQQDVEVFGLNPIDNN